MLGQLAPSSTKTALLLLRMVGPCARLAPPSRHTCPDLNGDETPGDAEKGQGVLKQTWLAESSRVKFALLQGQIRLTLGIPEEMSPEL